MKKEKLKKKGNTNEGITLIVLVITIIVLLILAGITLYALLGENGILSRAEKARKEYEEAQKKELDDLDKLYSSLLIGANDSSQVTIKVEDLKTLINQTVEEKLEENSAGPVGTVISYMGNTAPKGYLSCDGTTYQIAEYPKLAEQIKNEFGSYNYYGGDGETTFSVPDLRGEFLRGTGTNGHSKQGNGAQVGKHQDGTQHIFTTTDGSSGTNGIFYVFVDNSGSGGFRQSNFDSIYSYVAKARLYNQSSLISYSGTPALFTSRPTNTSVLYCIKY